MSATLSWLVRRMDALLMPEVEGMSLGAVCIEADARVPASQMALDEAREIMAEIDAKASALLAVLAIILAISAFLFSLSDGWLNLILMFAQVAVISLSITYLLRCLIYEPAPHLRGLLESGPVRNAFPMQIEAIKQVRYFNRVIVQTAITALLFFLMCALIAADALLMGRAP